jgi:putative flippase GtrA
MNVAQILRFALVGLIQNAVNLATFAGLHVAGAGYGVAALVAALVALAVSFVLNNYWTFARTAVRRLRGDLARYGAVFATAVLAGIALLALQVELLGLPAVPAQAIAIVVVAPASFLAQRFWVFR